MFNGLFGLFSAYFPSNRHNCPFFEGTKPPQVVNGCLDAEAKFCPCQPNAAEQFTTHRQHCPKQCFSSTDNRSPLRSSFCSRSSAANRLVLMALFLLMVDSGGGCRSNRHFLISAAARWVFRGSLGLFSVSDFAERLRASHRSFAETPVQNMTCH